MDLPLKEQFSIFLYESIPYVAAQGGFALLVFLIVTLVEASHRGQSAGLVAIVLGNVAVLLLSITLFGASLWIVGWRSQWLGGETSAAIIACILSIAAIYAAKGFGNDWIGLALNSPRLHSVVIATVVTLPQIVFAGFVFMMSMADFSK